MAKMAAKKEKVQFYAWAFVFHKSIQGPINNTFFVAYSPPP